MLKHDLEVAGIPYVDENGRFGDFHALRHTFITNMVKSGVSPKAAQSLARHSTIDLTMNVYTTLTVHDQASAMATLPPIPTMGVVNPEDQGLRATGTNGFTRVPTVVPRGAENGAILPAPSTLHIAPDCTDAREVLKRPRVATPKPARTIGTEVHQLASDCTEKDEEEERGPSRIRTGDGGFAIRCLSRLAKGPRLTIPHSIF